MWFKPTSELNKTLFFSCSDLFSCLFYYFQSRVDLSFSFSSSDVSSSCLETIDRSVFQVVQSLVFMATEAWIAALFWERSGRLLALNAAFLGLWAIAALPPWSWLISVRTGRYLRPSRALFLPIYLPHTSSLHPGMLPTWLTHWPLSVGLSHETQQKSN